MHVTRVCAVSKFLTKVVNDSTDRASPSVRQPSSTMERQGEQDVCIVTTKSRDLPHLKIGSSMLKAEFDDGGDFYAEKAKNELRETPEVVEQALKDYKAMLKGTVSKWQPW